MKAGTFYLHFQTQLILVTSRLHIGASNFFFCAVHLAFLFWMSETLFWGEGLGTRKQCHVYNGLQLPNFGTWIRTLILWHWTGSILSILLYLFDKNQPIIIFFIFRKAWSDWEGIWKRCPCSVPAYLSVVGRNRFRISRYDVQIPWITGYRISSYM